MLRINRTLAWGYWLITAAAFELGLFLILDYAPVEKSMGLVQKNFYVHLPSAICTFLAFLVNFVACIGYLSTRKDWWDDLADATARVGVLLCSVVLITGMIWGKTAWGQWWTWSPRLTFSLVLWLLYVVYLMVRSSVESGQRRALLGAVYGIIAFLDVPLVWLSVKLMPDIHPTSIELAPAMKVTLAYWFLPVTLLSLGLIVARYRSNVRSRAVKHDAQVDPAQPVGFTLAGGKLS